MNVNPPLPFGEETVLFGRRVGAQQAAGYVRLAIALSERLADHIDAAFALIDDAYDRFHAVDDRYGEAYALSQHGHALRGWVSTSRRIPTCDGRSRFGATCATSGPWQSHSRAGH